MTNNIKDIDDALIRLPVIIVINVAVFLGLSLKILNLALPIFVPSKSPKEDIKPPSKSKKIIKSQPDTNCCLSFFYIINITINKSIKSFSKGNWIKYCNLFSIYI